MKNSSKKIFSLLLIMIMLISSTGVVNAATNGYIYGYWYNTSASATSSSISASITSEPESSTEPDASVYLYGTAYNSSGVALGYIEASGSPSCSDTHTRLSSVYRGIVDFSVDGYQVETKYAYA